MTWQLMRRDAALRWLPLLTLASAVFCVLWQWQGVIDFENGAGSLIFVAGSSILTYLACMAVITQQEDTDFQSTLPITVRQVYLAQTLSMYAVLWIPASLILADGPRAVPWLTVVDFVSALTLAMAGIQSAAVFEISITASITGLLAPAAALVTAGPPAGLDTRRKCARLEAGAGDLLVVRGSDVSCHLARGAHVGSIGAGKGAG